MWGACGRETHLLEKLPNLMCYLLPLRNFKIADSCHRNRKDIEGRREEETVIPAGGGFAGEERIGGKGEGGSKQSYEKTQLVKSFVGQM